MSFDTSANPEAFVVWQHPNRAEVLGPANMTDGACFGREPICMCVTMEWAQIIAALLNKRRLAIAPAMTHAEMIEETLDRR